MAKNHLPRIARYFISVILGTGAVLFVIELFLRFFINSPGMSYVFDTELGLRPIAGTVWVWGLEGWGTTRYSADGEIATPYQGGPNVVVLGDSYTEAWQVNDADKYVSVAETLLWQRGVKVDLRNLGVSGATVADYVYLASYIHKNYHPSLVVIQLLASNFETRPLAVSRDSHFVWQNGELRLERKTPVYDVSPSLARRLNRSLAIVNYAYLRFLRIQTAFAQRKADVVPEVLGSTGGLDNQDRDAIARAELAALDTAYADVPVIVVLLPDIPKIEQDRLIAEEPEYVRLRALAKSCCSWQVVDPLDEFMQLPSKGKMPRGFANTEIGIGHLNSDGHTIVGKLLADQIQEAFK